MLANLSSHWKLRLWTGHTIISKYPWTEQDLKDAKQMTYHHGTFHLIGEGQVHRVVGRVWWPAFIIRWFKLAGKEL